MSADLSFTGERFIPGVPGEIWYEHWHRYHFALPLVEGREVLDVACGAGYGSALLAQRAARVTGADISQAAIDHARERYAPIANLEFARADCAALPFPDASFDAVVSFETIEHIDAQEAFLDQVRRVLRPGGLLVLSCPNKVEYTDKRGASNEFHVRELYRDELSALLTSRFGHAKWFGQRPGFYSVVWAEQGSAQGEIFEVAESSAQSPSAGHARPMYFIVVATDSADALERVAPRVSVLADRDEWVYGDYEKVTRSLDAAHRRGNALEEKLGDAERHYAEAILERDVLEAAQTEALAQRASLEARIAAQQEEISRRASFRWWLALPLRRLARALKGEPPGG